MMTKRPLLIFTAALFSMSVPQFVRAQDSKSARYPAAVLVMLNSEQNRIRNASRANNIENLELVKTDASGVIAATKNDFHDNFNYCPVYYFMDTNSEKVKNGQLTGIITNEDGSNVTDVPLYNCIVAYYGFPDAHPNPDMTFKKGLVISDCRMKQLTDGCITIAFRHSRKKNKYAYNSKRFDIDYKPCAGVLNKLITNSGLVDLHAYQKRLNTEHYH